MDGMADSDVTDPAVLALITAINASRFETGQA
jgi:hypothetical protein